MLAWLTVDGILLIGSEIILFYADIYKKYSCLLLLFKEKVRTLSCIEKLVRCLKFNILDCVRGRRI